jgi:hypothetical protein
MPRNGRTVRASADTVEAMRRRGESRSDWDAAQRMPQAEVERLAVAEDSPLPEGWESAVEIGLPARKQAVHMQLDADVLDWFRARARLPDPDQRRAAELRTGTAAEGGEEGGVAAR